MRRLEELEFDNSYARLPAELFEEVLPTPVPGPVLAAFNEDAAALVGLAPAEASRTEFAEFFAGNRLLPGARPLAMLYAGHQFGVWVPQLGDGRAILLGEVRAPDGRKWDLQLKGAGRTRFSRRGDGRAVLRSTIREYLCSEAMHGLGIPTTRALCIVSSPLPVYREEVATAALLTRVAPSHVRFGSFEILAYRGEHELLRALADDVIRQHFPELEGEPDRHARLLAEVVRLTAELVARWQAVGFAHGVMNTDNMSILGITLDYGPFGFLDAYDPGLVCNHSDDQGRYAFDQQPRVAEWNLRCLAHAFLPLVSREHALAALGGFGRAFDATYGTLVRAKLGLATPEDDDAPLARDLLRLMRDSGVDYARFFRALASFDSSADAAASPLRDEFLDREAFDAWALRYAARLRREGSVDPDRRARMLRVNPKYVLRNWVAEAVIRSARQGEFAEIDRVRRVLRAPFDEHAGFEQWAEPPPEWAKHLAVSCSS